MYNVYFVPGAGLDDEYATSVLDEVIGTMAPEAYRLGASKEQVLEYLRGKHAEEGWADELGDQLYGQHHGWGQQALAYFEATGAPISMPVRHGAYVLACDVS